MYKTQPLVSARWQSTVSKYKTPLNWRSTWALARRWAENGAASPWAKARSMDSSSFPQRPTSGRRAARHGVGHAAKRQRGAGTSSVEPPRWRQRPGAQSRTPSCPPMEASPPKGSSAAAMVVSRGQRRPVSMVFRWRHQTAWMVWSRVGWPTPLPSPAWMVWSRAGWPTPIPTPAWPCCSRCWRHREASSWVCPIRGCAYARSPFEGWRRP
mmetsp:Transcript_102685/g.329118  ORF Transcript_102685/g.329118 Transcript_102685/m.329118 type:complete len:211 (+) Transcript_102685:149-781(+)